MGTKKKIMKNISYAVVTNLVIFLSGILTTVFVPKILNIGNYSYWQLYMFYGTYIIYVEFGWLEGIYLREGGNKYRNLNFNIYNRQLKMLSIYGFICISVLWLGIYMLKIESNKKYVIGFVGIYFFLVLLKSFFSYIFQATGEIQKYARLNIIERLAFIVILLSVLSLESPNYILVIIGDIIARIISLVVAMIYGKEIILEKASNCKEAIIQVGENINSGSKLMFATVAGLLIIGVIRLGIERYWDLETFGKVSFTISISNLVITFIGAISTVLFPILSNIHDHERLRILYLNMKVLLGILAFALLGMYLPISKIIIAWLPEYIESVRYMALIFPICFFESKMSILIITFLKALRKEKKILQINIIALLMSCIVSTTVIYGMKNLELAVLTILFVSMFKCILAEIILSKILNVSMIIEMIIEILIAIVFVYANWFVGGIKGFILYMIVFLCYFVINYKKVIGSIMWLKK